jgi:hypothetical protein
VTSAIVQAVSRWLPTTAARVRARIWSCGICGGESGAGAGFLRVLRFPLPIFIPPIAPQSSSSIIWGLYNRPEVAAVPSGLSPTPIKKSVTMLYYGVHLLYIIESVTIYVGRCRSKKVTLYCCLININRKRRPYVCIILSDFYIIKQQYHFIMVAQKKLLN